MDIIEALSQRRTIHQFLPDPVPEQVLREMIDLAVFVPNHHLTQPWQFVVVQGDSLEHMASFREQAVLAKNREKPQAEAIARKAKLDVLAVPASIVAIQNLDPNPFRAEEDYAAVTMAVYNMTLVAHARHLGTYWHTGPLVYFEPFRAWLDLNPQQRIIAYLFVGYPARTPHPERIAGNERTRWLS
ncbi:MAG: nitroreductase [Firmicutes bacterium]|jgi:nitroreductase|nr:nitroreductase [Bacillota bacterium]MCL5064899.1 nitroreductase [Bacillota bacterium]